MDLLTVITFVAGLVLLLVGAEVLVRSASQLASLLGISPLIIGLTVVAFGTSAPEMAVTVQAAASGDTALALGNVVGSNIFNILLILGLSAAITPLIVDQKLVRFDVPLIIVASATAFALASDGTIDRFDGGLLFFGLVLFLIWNVVKGPKEKRSIVQEYEGEIAHHSLDKPRPWFIDVGLLLAGLGLLVLGSRWMVQGAVSAAEAFGLSDSVIGLTIVAAGTSLPEVATSVMAALRKANDIAVGNVIGSNLFNLLGVLGLGSIVAPGGIPASDEILRFDFVVMLVASVACLPIFFSRAAIRRWEGFLFFGYFCAYITYLLMDISESENIGSFRLVMGVFVVPITVITLGIITVNEFRRRRSVRQGQPATA